MYICERASERGERAPWEHIFMSQEHTTTNALYQQIKIIPSRNQECN